MPCYILKIPTPIGDRYLEWSTIAEAPVTYGMTLDEFRDYYRDEYGHADMEDLPKRLARADATGCSGVGRTLAEVVLGNRAGVDGTEMTLDEIVEWYCVRRDFPRIQDKGGEERI